ncbi:MAG TPA: OmpA family protein [bacterium]|nr:OmpA family protein [bacterium]HPN45975.1 OmpA family protein [bacterium]
MKNLFLFVIVMLCLTQVMYAQQSQGKTQIGIFGSAEKQVGDDRDDSGISPWFGISLGYTFTPRIGMNLDWAMGWNRPYDSSKDNIGKYFKTRPGTPAYRTYLYPLVLNLKYNLLPEKSINPYFVGGLGFLFWDLRDISDKDSILPLTPKGEQVHGVENNFLINLGFGSEFFVTNNFAFDLSLRYQQLLGQDLDMSGFGDVQTGNIEARLGLNWYLAGWKDTDNDGVEDKLDKCPKEAEDIDGFQDLDGCPDLDNDNDGVPDTADAAVNEAEDIDGFQDNDGKPDLDNDNDGIPDAKDKCPNKAEDKDGFEDTDGCPDLDNDNDGIADDKDKCPNEAETKNGFEDEDGCPDKKPEVMLDKKPMVLEGVTFNTGSSELTENAKIVLDAVVRTMTDYPDLTVLVRGHTDSKGNRAYNIKLSKLRAESVKAYLVGRGVSSQRLETAGIGPDEPIDTNDTEAGRARNRRIEFVRLK